MRLQCNELALARRNESAILAARRVGKVNLRSLNRTGIAMILYYQTHSPFARKALVFAHEVGIADRLEVIHHETSPTLRNERVYGENPLGKVPVLLRPDASPLFDSDVICAYLDTLHDGRKLVPEVGEARWQALRLQSLAQGLAQAGINMRWETERRPEPLRYGALAEGYREKIEAS